jgi:hypothetical protein
MKGNGQAHAPAALSPEEQQAVVFRKHIESVPVPTQKLGKKKYSIVS